MESDPVFGLDIPTACQGVPAEILKPRNTWADPNAYDATARQLASRFQANFEAFVGDVAADVRDAGPRVG